MPVGALTVGAGGAFGSSGVTAASFDGPALARGTHRPHLEHVIDQVWDARFAG